MTLKDAAQISFDVETALSRLKNVEWTRSLDGERLRRTALIFSISSPLFRFAVKERERFLWALDNLTDESRVENYINSWKGEKLHFWDEARKFKYTALTGITLLILESHYSYHSRTSRLLSLLADKLIIEAISHLFSEDNLPLPSVIAYGKLGSEELNYSSDLDLAFFSTVTEAEVPLHEKVLKLFIREFSSPSPLGFLFRIDVDLRPGGRFAPLLITRDAFLNYYLTHGGVYQRFALIRARPVGGDVREGISTLKELEQFVYRKYLDFYAFKEMEELKRKIASYRSDVMDVKTGPGGIREVEFVVHALQITYGGKIPRLRTRSTYEAVQRLSEANLLTDEDATILRDAYSFLRKTEDILQMFEERQTHTLRGARTEALSRAMGFKNVEDFTEHLNAIRKRVQKIFDEILGVKVSSGAHEIFVPEDVKDIFTELQEKVDGELAELVIKKIEDLPHRRQAGLRFLEFLRKVPFKKTYITLFTRNPRTLEFLLNLMGSSAMLSSFFTSHPEMVDSLVLKTYVMPVKDRQLMEEELKSRVKEVRDYEEYLNALRIFKKEEWLRIATNDVNFILQGIDVSSQLTHLAEVIINELLKRVSLHTGLDRDVLSIIGFGKLGAGDLNYHSDLDIVFLYPTEEVTSTEKIIKTARRFITALSASTREGVLYPVDMRLRPSGTAGPLASSTGAFEEYYMKTARPWEVLALTRARPVAGNEKLKKFLESVQLISYRKHIDVLPQEAVNMKERFEKELAKKGGGIVDIKYAPGGLSEIDFILQILLARASLEAGKNIHSNTVSDIHLLAEAGYLNNSERETLLRSYEILTEIERRIRLIEDRAVHVLTESDLEKLHFRIGGNKVRISLKELELTMRDVRKIFKKVAGH